MRLALGQLRAVDDVPTNLGLVGDVVGQAADAGADLLLLPEYAMYERARVDASFGEVAEPLDGRFGTAVAELARVRALPVVIGMVERDPRGGLPFNTLAAFGAGGELLGSYRKIHLFDSFGFRESEWIAAAPEPLPVVVPVAEARVGLMTCYDLRFPELARALVDDGADVLAACSSWVPGPHKLQHWDVLARARAIENGAVVAAVTQAQPISIGRSLVVDPDGTVIAQAGLEAQLLVADIDLAVVARARTRDPGYRSRRL
ncbi:Predicted amidohydrolase [Quadrisphaera granulorum]|uniref:Putative amidohydrolase n=1 Tax=Quadrisphaera granulorum TaxID=317664 RepID=A0A316A589_9ACTN|nr:carbon-nitrogen hydrolase family protein [Quadrisphaera granulorum]PWJ53061.1 putative amidohydrolase [Quadrisphaera granulorum]SZE97226.1 Predicted amidohydrolase [Quadrisphaera granulorum]